MKPAKLLAFSFRKFDGECSIAPFVLSGLLNREEAYLQEVRSLRSRSTLDHIVVAPKEWSQAEFLLLRRACRDEVHRGLEDPSIPRHVEDLPFLMRVRKMSFAFLLLPSFIFPVEECLKRETNDGIISCFERVGVPLDYFWRGNVGSQWNWSISMRSEAMTNLKLKSFGWVVFKAGINVRIQVFSSFCWLFINFDHPNDIPFLWLWIISKQHQLCPRQPHLFKFAYEALDLKSRSILGSDTLTSSRSCNAAAVCSKKPQKKDTET